MGRGLTRLLEQVLFRRRRLVVACFLLATIAMTWSASQVQVDAGFNKQLPLRHEYIRTFLEYADSFGGANRIVVALMTREGDIFTPEFFAALKELTDAVFFVPGVDRASVTSLFTPNVRFVEAVEDGLAGGNVIPANFEPTPEGLEIVRENVIKSGRLGQLVANDFTGAIVSAQLLEIDPSTGQKLDYLSVARHLESDIREPLVEKYADEGFSVHIIGFARIVGDVSEGAREIVFFFVLSVALTTLLVRFFAQSWRYTFPPIFCSVLAVVWQLGILHLAGYGIDPMSILIPFLVFAIGVSHGVQMVRAYRGEIFDGAGHMQAARNSFSHMLIPGVLALGTDTIGFITLLLIDVGIISELAVTASLGVAVIILTNLFLLPVLLSFVKLPREYIGLLRKRASALNRLWTSLDAVTRFRPALLVLAAAALLFGFAAWKAREVRIGDLAAGVPELREDSRYNRDTAVITSRFSIGVDVLATIVETVPNGCVDPEIMDLIDWFGWNISLVPGVQSVASLATVAKVINAGWNEGSLKWRTLPENSQTLALSVAPVETSSGLLNADGSVMPVYIFLTDHRAETIDRVVAAVEGFQKAHPNERVRFRLATGNAGVMAATNQVVRAAQFPMLLWVFASITVLCLVTFRSWRAAVCIVTPLALVSVLAYALMAWLGIGLKVHTLPVAALGVGIGVDYGIYLFSRLNDALRRGDYLEEAMLEAFAASGTAVIFTGLTLALSVATWLFSDLKFQADMGLLLAFMFIVNMLGAIILLPAIARWLFRHHRTASAG